MHKEHVTEYVQNGVKITLHKTGNGKVNIQTTGIPEPLQDGRALFTLPFGPSCTAKVYLKECDYDERL